ELGWELYIPTEFSFYVYDLIVAAGEKIALQHAGFHAMESLRVEKAYRAWGTDIVDQDTPLEAGLDFAVAFDKTSDFIGKEALLRQRSQGLRKKLAVFTVDDPTPLLLGDEPIFHDGVVVGRITSGAYGHTIGRSMGLDWIESEVGIDTAILEAGGYEIEVATERFTATASLYPQYDPKVERVRA
ncbi:MAG: glycine cleavage T C-terminal barrel domain-containing protein, partial [SAR202 cluster bacterium]|nr:glycine cleavage T C-terminal barrel domain-containing protein [SAR202 cluster bacterium]